MWLRDDVGPNLAEVTEILPHGGTALTLLGLKDSTKDVDFSFRAEGDFKRLVQVLKKLSYETTLDVKSRPNEHLIRLENPKRRVDVVDLRYPTWNDWRITTRILEKAIELPIGNVRLIRLDKETIFLFKTYPLRETDVSDLRTILDVSSLDGDRVISLFDEQDAMHRRELTDTSVEHEPLINILNLRVRFAGSLQLIGPKYRRLIPKVARHANRKLRDLGLGKSLRDLIDILRDVDGVPDWDRIAGRQFEHLTRRLALE